MKVAALTCAALSGLGCVIFLTGGAPLEECLPPTILLSIASVILCLQYRAKRVNEARTKEEPDSKETPGARYDWKQKELWEDYPFHDYNKYHTYCRVAMDANGKLYYYRTRNPRLKIGDRVYVPVGRASMKKTGKIVSMENVTGEDIPYPLEKTKFIIGKAE